MNRSVIDSWFVRGSVIFAILIVVVVAASSLVRRNVVIRKEPLANPIMVASVSSDLSLTLADTTTVRLAGITPPQSPKQLAAAMSFLKVAVAQGIEIDQRLPDGSVIARGELRVFNTCGTGNIRAWYHQIELNTWLIASNCTPGVPTDELVEPVRAAFNTAARAAEELRLSSDLSTAPSLQFRIEPELGLSIGDYLVIQGAVRVARSEAELDTSLP